LVRRVGPEAGVRFHAVPARHFSGRLIKRNKTLWAGFAVEGGGKRILFGGDSGYGPHYAEAGRNFDGFDLVILENGQYDEAWPHIHMLPEETARAAEELGSKALLPAHSGKFSIANHPWDDPFKRIATASLERPYRLLTPKIGEVVYLDDREQTFPHWWEGME
jgi:L-ascorbate metabolism protein UlaG (beta-lactamase superfamily)